METRSREDPATAVAADSLWRQTRRLTLVMAALWLLLNVGGPWIARDLYGWLGSGFPFGFWFAAQGSLFLYLLLILVLVVLCERLERRYVAQAWGEGDRSDAPSDNR